MSSNSFQIAGFCVSHVLSHFLMDAKAGYTRTGNSSTGLSVQTCKVIISWERKKEAKTLASHRIYKSPSGSIRRCYIVGFCI